jgi:hypothetical protein
MQPVTSYHTYIFLFNAQGLVPQFRPLVHFHLKGSVIYNNFEFSVVELLLFQWRSGPSILCQGFWWPNILKFHSWNFSENNFNLFIPRPPWRTSKLQEKPSALKWEHPAHLNINFFNFFYFLVRVIFALLDPDPADQHQCGFLRIRIHNTGYFLLVSDFNFTCA